MNDIKALYDHYVIPTYGRFDLAFIQELAVSMGSPKGPHTQEIKPALLLNFEQQCGAALSFLLALSPRVLTFTAGRNIERKRDVLAPYPGKVEIWEG